MDERSASDQTGMSLRDYFAGQALAGMWANEAWAEECAKQTNGRTDGLTIGSVFAVRAYESADSLLAQRDSERQSK
jgi:hypothetical protein